MNGIIAAHLGMERKKSKKKARAIGRAFFWESPGPVQGNAISERRQMMHDDDAQCTDTACNTFCCPWVSRPFTSTELQSIIVISGYGLSPSHSSRRR